MASKKKPSPDFLQAFSNPLWRVVRLRNVRAEWIVDSSRNGWSYTVVQIRHRSLSWFANVHQDAATTFFIIHLPKSSDRWCITAGSAGNQVGVDNSHVYLAQVSKTPRVSDWGDLLDRAINIANTLKELSPEQQLVEQNKPVWNANDQKTTISCFLLGGIWVAVLAKLGFDAFIQLQTASYISMCGGNKEFATVLTGADARLYITMLLLPILGQIKLALTAQRRMYRPWFALRFYAETILFAFLTFICFSAAFSLPVWQEHLPDGELVSCYAAPIKPKPDKTL